MAEISLFMTESDELQIVRFALQRGCKLVPDLDYASPQYVTIEDEHRFIEFRERTRLFFLVNEAYFVCPFEIRKIVKGGKAAFYIDQRSGGPAIQFMAGGLFTEDAQRFIRPGFLGYHPTFWNTQTAESQKAPTMLLNEYRRMSRFTQENAARIKPASRVYWLWPEAQREIRDGAKLVGFENKTADEVIQT